LETVLPHLSSAFQNFKRFLEDFWQPQLRAVCISRGKMSEQVIGGAENFTC